MTKTALYLAGGGARGAYQAGVLKAIQHLTKGGALPFDIISGVSVGSLNAAILAEQATDFKHATEKLELLWKQIASNDIFDASNFGLSKSLMTNIGRGLVTQRQASFLLNSAPLQTFIRQHIHFDTIRHNLEKGLIDAFEIISHCYENQQTISFYQHHEAHIEDWQYPRHISQRATLAMEHILASSALPLFFPTVNIDGFHYGDGSMGLVSPLRGAIRFQATRVLVIGTRPLAQAHAPAAHAEDVGFANILGSMLSGLFVDNLDRDIEMVNRMNEISLLLSVWRKWRSPWRPIQTLYIRPSRDIATIAQAQYHTMPTVLRFMLNLLGAKSHSGDLVSFLLFEPAFTTELLALGYHDGMQAKEDILNFFGK